MDIEELEKLANAATPGPWHQHRVYSDHIDDASGRAVIEPTGSEYDRLMARQDARFIAAANPAAILSLLARLKAAEAVVEAVRRYDEQERFPGGTGGDVSLYMPMMDALEAWKKERGE